MLLSVCMWHWQAFPECEQEEREEDGNKRLRRNAMNNNADQMVEKEGKEQQHWFTGL